MSNEESSEISKNESDTKVKTGGNRTESLKVLCKQIEAGIRSLKGRDDSDRIISRIKGGDVLDESGYALKLFECYSTIVSTQTKELTQTKVSQRTEVINFDDSSNGDEMTDLDDIQLIQEVPEYLYQGTGKQIAGWDAFRRNIFWIRFAIMACCLISFSVMESLPHIDYGGATSDMLLSRECEISSHEGDFSYSYYKFASVMGIVTWLYSFFFCLYYLLPVDSLERKYLPIYTIKLSPFRWEKRNIGLFERKTSSRYVEVFFDALLLIMCLFAAIAAAVAIDDPDSFYALNIWSTECVYGVCEVGGCMNENKECEGCDGNICDDGTCANPDGVCENICEVRCLDGSCPNENGECDYGPDGILTIRVRTGPNVVSYSLHSFVETYKELSSDCMNHNPVAIIRASLVFLFLAVILMAVALQISLRSLYLEKYKRDVASGKKGTLVSDDSSHA